MRLIEDRVREETRRGSNHRFHRFTQMSGWEGLAVNLNCRQWNKSTRGTIHPFPGRDQCRLPDASPAQGQFDSHTFEVTFSQRRDPKATRTNQQAGSLFYPFDALSLAQGRSVLFGVSSDVPRLTRNFFQNLSVSLELFR
jgi:hypothetical protein